MTTPTPGAARPAPRATITLYIVNGTRPCFQGSRLDMLRFLVEHGYTLVGETEALNGHACAWAEKLPTPHGAAR